MTNSKQKLKFKPYYYYTHANHIVCTNTHKSAVVQFLADCITHEKYDIIIIIIITIPYKYSQLCQYET